ncbi:MAG: Na/Pi symporter [Sulfurospirillaceae bacterium]|nr:Na/Pi symporter [Sulfurospirillaceae bacterium]MDD3462521.1 Na/Pi symporter [Sulfurospirillaceae bacterium]
MKRLILIITIVGLSYVFMQSNNILNISAGVAIFLFGMLSLEEGFRSFAGGILEGVLKKFTNKQYKSILFGAITTSIMQSSSLVSIISISFISAGLISLAQGIGIIFGANIGTTTGAWLIAGFGLKVDIAKYAMPMLVFGTIFMFQSSKKAKGLGYILAGLGFLFLGIAYMKEGFDAFKASIDLTQFSVDGIKGVLLFTFIGILATVVMQSSHATLVLIITALAANQITYENALALAIGSNVGTTITAVIGSLTAGLEGKKLATAHVLFNVVTGIIAILFINQFIKVVELTAGVLHVAQDDYTLKLAIFHTYFNVLGVALMYPFISTLVTQLNKIFKKKASVGAEESDDVRFINDIALDFPDTAHKVLIKETRHLYYNAFDIISRGLSVYKEDITSGMEVDDIIALRNEPLHVDLEELYEKRIKDIYGKIINFAILAQGKFGEDVIRDIVPIKNANISIVEAIKATKHMQKNMIKYLGSNNEYIKEQYNHIRKNLIKHLRSMQVIFNSSEEDVAILLLSKLKFDAKKYDIAANKALDNLIRNNQVPYSMATSLMNDTTYAFNIASQLTEVASTLFVHQDKNLREEREALILNNADIAKMSNSATKEVAI